MGEVLRLTEGSLSPVACLNGENNTCPRAKTCRTIRVWTELDDMIEDYLDGVTIADLMCERIDDDGEGEGERAVED